MKYNIEAPKQASPSFAGGAQAALPKEEVWLRETGRHIWREIYIDIDIDVFFFRHILDAYIT